MPLDVIPSCNGTILALLRLLGDGAEHDVGEAREKLAAHFKLTPDERKQLLPSGRVAIFDSRVGWGKTCLEEAALLTTIRRGVYRITDAGRSALAENPARIDKAYLMRFDSFRASITGAEADTSASGPSSAPSVVAGMTPEESLGKAYREIRNKVERTPADRRCRHSPAAWKASEPAKGFSSHIEVHRRGERLRAQKIVLIDGPQLAALWSTSASE